MSETVYRPLGQQEISRALFRGFIRRQEVNLCWRREGEGWTVKPDPFVDDWSEAEYDFLVDCLRRTAKGGGLVLGAFAGKRLAGFVSVEGEPIGSRGQYADMTSLHVSRDCRRRGIGRELVRRAAAWARERGAQGLYASTHSAAETQHFYLAQGFADAREPWPPHAVAEPYDRQMELIL